MKTSGYFGEVESLSIQGSFKIVTRVNGYKYGIRSLDGRFHFNTNYIEDVIEFFTIYKQVNN